MCSNGMTLDEERGTARLACATSHTHGGRGLPPSMTPSKFLEGRAPARPQPANTTAPAHGATGVAPSKSLFIFLEGRAPARPQSANTAAPARGATGVAPSRSSSTFLEGRAPACRAEALPRRARPQSKRLACGLLHAAMFIAALADPRPICAQIQALAEITYATAADFDRCTRDRFLCVDADTGGVRLARSWLVATEQGVSSKISFTLTATNQARKTLVLALPPGQAAELQLFHTQGSAAKPLLIRVNGRHTLTNNGEGGRSHFGWYAQPVPPAWLHAGTNEFVFSHAGRLVLDTRSPNAGSAMSYDAGQSWHPADGEFIVRLRVGGYAPAGVLTSDILDAGRRLVPGRAIGPWGEPESVALSSLPDEPDLRHQGSGSQGSGKITPSDLNPEPRTLNPVSPAVPSDVSNTSAPPDPGNPTIAWSWRAGHTPLVEPIAWTPWQTNWPAQVAGRRFFQWRARFVTDHPGLSPVLRRVTLHLQGRAPAPAGAGLQLEPDLEPPRLDSSYPFTWERDTPRIRHLRDRYGLTNLITGLDSDLARTTAIRRWASRQWNQGWNAGRYQYIPPWDTLILLDMAPSNLCLGMCTHYATAYVQASSSLGFLSRHLIVDHHCLAESFLDDQARWILQDPGPGPGPDGFPVGVFYTATNGPALNALDLHRLLADQVEVLALPAAEEGPARGFDKLALFCRFGIPLRNNHLSVPEPAEEEHGQDHYHYDSYLWWADNLDDPLPNVRGFSLLSNRPADFYPSINRTWADLVAISNGLLRVTLWTDTPHAMGFEIRQDSGGRDLPASPEPRVSEREAPRGGGGPPSKNPSDILEGAASACLAEALPRRAAPSSPNGGRGLPPSKNTSDPLEGRASARPSSSGDWKPSPPVFTWPLQPGRNVLEARSRNPFGRPGQAAQIEVTWTNTSEILEGRVPPRPAPQRP